MCTMPLPNIERFFSLCVFVGLAFSCLNRQKGLLVASCWEMRYALSETEQCRRVSLSLARSCCPRDCSSNKEVTRRRRRTGVHVNVVNVWRMYVAQVAIACSVVCLVSQHHSSCLSPGGGSHSFLVDPNPSPPPRLPPRQLHEHLKCRRSTTWWGRRR